MIPTVLKYRGLRMSGERNSIPIYSVDESKICGPIHTIEKVTLIVTKGCNLSCDYCFEKHLQGQYMSSEIAFGAIEKYKPSIVKFFGGEPLLNRKLIKDIMDTFGDSKTYELTTNAIYAHKVPIKYWTMMSSVNISIDGLFSRDSSRWRDEREYDGVLYGIRWISAHATPDRCVINITTSAKTMYEYSLLERVIDLYGLTGIAHFDINIVVYDATGILVLDEDGRQEFIRQCMELYSYSIENGGMWDIGLNEAVFATKDASNTCCAFQGKKQVAVDINGFENHCHVAAYYNIPNRILEEATAKSDAACVMIELMGEKNGQVVPLDRENFSIISAAERYNNGMYYARNPKERVIFR
jgi:sulfatase maturation enzyme AslB (radical SAM superfamily)